MVRKIVFIIGIILAIAVAVVVLLFSLLGVNLVQFSPFNVSVSVGNSPPTIEIVEFTNVGAVLGGVREVLINFSASDLNGAADLNDSSARVEIYNSSKGVAPGMRVNSTCSMTLSSVNTKNYTCTIGMWYFDPYSYYVVNATIADNSDLKAENSSAVFNYEFTPGPVIYPNNLGWDPIVVSDIDKKSTNDPLISNNTGNVNFSTLTMTAYDLPGVSSGFIYAGNFSVGTSDDCLGDVMANATGLSIGGAGLPVGNLSIVGAAQEELYFCIKAINLDTPATTFSSSNTGGTSWEIDFS